MSTPSVNRMEPTAEFRMPRHSSLLWGALSQWGATGLSVVLGLLITPMIIRGLGKEMYGLWGLVASFVGFYGLFDFGLSGAISRFLGNAMGGRDLARFNQVASTGKSLLTLAAMLVILCTLVMLGPADSFLRIPPGHEREFKCLALLSAGSMAISMIMAVYGGALLASEDFVFLNCVRVGATLSRSIGSLTAIKLGFGVLGMAIVNVVVTVLEEAAVYIRCRLRLSQVRAGWLTFNRTVAKALMGFAAAAFVVSTADLLRFRLDVTLVTRFQGLTAAGLYSVALTVIAYVFRVVTGLSLITWPRINRLYGMGNLAELQVFFLRASHLVAVCAAAVCGVLVGLAPLLVRLWVGPGYDVSATIARILICGFFLDVATNPGIGAFYATGRHKYFATQNSIEAVLSFSLACLLGARFGMIGVASGLAIPISLIKLTVQPWFVARFLSLPFGAYWSRTIAMPLLAMASLAGGLAWAERCLARTAWGETALLTAIAIIVGGTVMWLLALAKADRGYVVSRARDVWARLVHILGYGMRRPTAAASTNAE